MSWRNKKDRDKFFQRRSERYSRIGRQLEIQVEEILAELQDVGELKRFKRHKPNSRADRQGKDFTVCMEIDGKEVEISFGVTISQASLTKARIRYPKVPQFKFPIGTNKATIVKRVLELFDEGQ